MPSSGLADQERLALERLRMLRVAKDLFLSDWYVNAPRDLAFSAESRAQLARIAEESAQERERAMRLVEQWAGGGRAPPDAAERAADVARAARRDFLLQLIDAKESAGDVFGRAALIAPPELRDELVELAEIDWRHSLELRDLLVAEVQEAWRLRSHRGPADLA